jgi:hypothetical protein
MFGKKKTKDTKGEKPVVESKTGKVVKKTPKTVSKKPQEHTWKTRV